jgi:hypothetical protein
MKGLLVRVDGTMEKVNTDYETLKKCVGGYIEHIYPRSNIAEMLSTALKKPVHFICDEEFLLKHSTTEDVNMLGSLLYDGWILGNIVLVSVEGPEFCGFDDNILDTIIKY